MGVTTTIQKKQWNEGKCLKAPNKLFENYNLQLGVVRV